MSLIEPTLTLTYLEGSEPLQYGLKIKVDSVATNGVTLLSHQGVPTEPNEENTFQIIVNAGAQGDEELQIDLGEMALDPVDGEIEVLMHDSSSAVIGSKKIRAEEAQKESRPIGENW